MTRGAKMFMLANNRDRSNRDGNREGRMNYNMESNRDDSMRGNYEMESNYDAESRFRDRRGREHYDDGRFAPMRNEMQSNRWFPPYYDVDINRYEYELERPASLGGQMRMGGYDAESNGRGTQRRQDFDTRRNSTRNNGGGSMRMIGFDRPENEMRMGGSDASMPEYREMDHMGGSQPMHGSAKSHRAPHFDENVAMEWTAMMENSDGTTGPHWTMEQLEPIMKAKKIDLDPIEFFAAVNMIYSDYGEIIKKRNLGMDFYVDMAKAFLNDKDAGAEDKLAAYYEYVVKG